MGTGISMIPREESSTMRATLFHWLSTSILTQRGIAGTGGALKLHVRAQMGLDDVQTYFVDPTPESDQTGKAGELADAIIAEAEAHCEGSGGGTIQYLIRAHQNKQRGAIAERPLTITLDQANAYTPHQEANARGVLGEVMRQNSELHQSIQKMSAVQTTALSRIIAMQAEMNKKYESTAVDNLVMMKANIENQIGNEAEAFAKVRSAQMLDSILGVAAQHAIPMLLQTTLPHLMPMIISWATKPENEQLISKLLTSLATQAANGQPGAPNPLMAMMGMMGGGAPMLGNGNGNGNGQ